MANIKPVMIKNYDYVSFSLDRNKDGQTVLAIYGISNKTLSKLESGTIIKWDATRQDELDGYTDEPLKWSGEVYAVFEDLAIVWLY